MKISLKWINEFVDVSEYLNNAQALADILTKVGLEVEEIQNRAADFKSHTQFLIFNIQRKFLSSLRVLFAVHWDG